MQEITKLMLPLLKIEWANSISYVRGIDKKSDAKVVVREVANQRK